MARWRFSSVAVAMMPVRRTLFAQGPEQSRGMIMVEHEDDVMNKKVVFFNGFPQGLEEDPRDLSLVKPERPVVGPADQVVRVDVLNDSQRASHA